MVDDHHKKSELHTWAEIADYLGCSVRTAQNRETQLGLPVHRLPGEKSRVFARTSEIDAWREGSARDSLQPWSALWRLAATRQTKGALVISAVTILLFLGASFLQGSRRIPGDWRVRVDTLVVDDARGEELWRVPFDQDLREVAYDLPEGKDAFHDLDGDGFAEMLFVARYADDSMTQELICFSNSGTELWRWSAGRSVSTGTESFPDVFFIGEFRPLQLGNGAKGVIVTARERSQYATQVVVLDREGHLISEYWHAGNIGVRSDRLKVADIDGNGRSEIYLAGVNNARRLATLVVLDPIEMHGASAEETSEYTIVGFPALRRADGPSEIARVFFPRTAMNRLNDQYNVGISVSVDSQFITVSVEEELSDPSSPIVLYELRHDLSLWKVAPSSSYQAVHERLVGEGQLDLSFREQLDRLEAEFLRLARSEQHDDR